MDEEEVWMRRTRNVVMAVTALTMVPWAPLVGQVDQLLTIDQSLAS